MDLASCARISGVNITRIVWAARIGAIVILLIFALIMTSLYRRLQVMQAHQSKPAATQPSR